MASQWLGHNTRAPANNTGDGGFSHGGKTRLESPAPVGSCCSKVGVQVMQKHFTAVILKGMDDIREMVQAPDPRQAEDQTTAS